MNWETVHVETDIVGVFTPHIVIHNEDGSVTSFPADETNPRYVEFLARTAPEETA